MKQHFNNGTTLSEFVFELDKPEMTFERSYKQCIEYARLLETPLELGHFVPVKDGKVLSEPKSNVLEASEYVFAAKEDVENYKEAMEKVVFDGFEHRVNEDGELNIVGNGMNLFFAGKDCYTYNFGIIIKFSDLLGKCKMK